MHLMMSGKERFVLRSRLLYGKCTTRSQKSAIIDDLMQYIGYKSRKHVITVLTQSQNRQKRKKKGRRNLLDTKQVELLREIWAGMGYPCAKLMQPMLRDWVESRRKSQDFPAEYSDVKLPKLSAATIDRALSAFKLNKPKKTDDRLDLQRLKQSIPIVNRKEEVIDPGHLSIDTVTHCGGNLAGNFAWTLIVTDELTLWTQNRAIWNKGSEGTCAALLYILREIPFRIRSINSDNGSEFINYHLQDFIKKKYKTCKVTRSRPKFKNDNARIEERNRRLVREVVGDERLDDVRFVYLLNQLYKWVNLQHNHFIASMRLEKKEKCGRRIIKRYDKARTPYMRVLEKMKEGGRKERFIRLHESLNPWTIRNKIAQYAKEIAMLLSHPQPYGRGSLPSFPLSPHPARAVWAPLGGLFRGGPVTHLFLHFSSHIGRPDFTIAIFLRCIFLMILARTLGSG